MNRIALAVTSIDSPEASLFDVDCELTLSIVWDAGSTDADGRLASPAGPVIESARLNYCIVNGRNRTRDNLVDWFGEDAVRTAEEWLCETLEPTEYVNLCAAE